MTANASTGSLPVALRRLGDEAFVSLTTFRRSGAPVSTPIWIAPDGESLVMFTPSTSGKVKRLRNDSHVEVRPCNRRGRVAAGVRAVPATAEIVADPVAQRSPMTALRHKYGLEFQIFLFVERIAARRQPDRVVLRLTAG